MLTVALTADNKIITWGVNDNCALGRDTTWDEKLRDMDAESGEEEDGELNPSSQRLLRSRPDISRQTQFLCKLLPAIAAALLSPRLGLSTDGARFG